MQLGETFGETSRLASSGIIWDHLASVGVFSEDSRGFLGGALEALSLVSPGILERFLGSLRGFWEEFRKKWALQGLLGGLRHNYCNTLYLKR